MVGTKWWPHLGCCCTALEQTASFCCLSEVCIVLQKLSAAARSFCITMQTFYCKEAKWSDFSGSCQMDGQNEGCIAGNIRPALLPHEIWRVSEGTWDVMSVWGGDPSTAEFWQSGMGWEAGGCCSDPVVGCNSEQSQAFSSCRNFEMRLYVAFGRSVMSNSLSYFEDYLYNERVITVC